MHYVRAKYVMFGQNLHVVFHHHNIVCNQVVGLTLQIRQIQDSIHNHYENLIVEADVNEF